jgi:hypothetical protein
MNVHMKAQDVVFFITTLQSGLLQQDKELGSRTKPIALILLHSLHMSYLLRSSSPIDNEKKMAKHPLWGNSHTWLQMKLDAKAKNVRFLQLMAT